MSVIKYLNKLAGTTGKSATNAIKAIADLLPNGIAAVVPKTYVIGLSEAAYAVPGDAAVILFTDVQTEGITLPAVAPDNAKIVLVNSSTTEAITVTGAANLTSIPVGGQVTVYSGDVGGSGNLWVSVDSGTVTGTSSGE